MYVLTCSEIGADIMTCCADCTSSPLNKMWVYPTSLYDEAKPDQTMGIKALVCCKHIHLAKSIDRGWWLSTMMRRCSRYQPGDIATMMAVVENQRLYYKTWAEVHERVRDREGKSLKLVRTPKPRRNSDCPNCRLEWNEIVCDHCGYMG